MKSKFIGALVVIAVLFGACNKKATELASSPDGKKCVVQEVNYKYLTAKAKASFTSEGSSNNFSLNIRMKKNKVIWLSASMIIEGMRCKITPDSIYVLNRLKGEYYAYSFADISRMINTEVNFASVQALLLGNLFMSPNRNTNYDFDDSHCILSQKQGTFDVKSFILNNNQKLEKVEVSQNGKNATTLSYGEFEEVDNYLFPFFVSLMTDAEKEEDKVELLLNFKNIKLLKKAPKFPFSIPDKYEKAK